MGAWAMLKKSRGRTWRVTGGAVRKSSLFDEATPKQLTEYKDAKKWRIIYCEEGVTIGVYVTLSRDGNSVCWPPETRP